MSGSPAAYDDGAVVVVPALGVVVRHRAHERQLHVRVALLDDPVRVDHAERVLPGIEAGDLRQQRPLDVDPELVDDVGGVLGRERHVLRRERVDRRRPDEATAGRPSARGHVLAHVEDRRRRSAQIDGSRKSRTSWFGVERSMWQRQIHFAPRRREVVDHRDRLRVVDDHEVVVVRRTRRRSARCSGGRSRAARRRARAGRPGARCGSSS